MWAAIIQMIMQGVSAIGQAGVQNAQAKYTEKTLKNNATINRAMARDAVSRGQKAESFKRMETAQKKSEQRANLGASGIDVGSGSAALVQEDTDIIGEIDALMIRENAKRESDRYEQAATQQDQQAKFVKKAEPYQRFGTILGGASNVSSTWMNSGQGS